MGSKLRTASWVLLLIVGILLVVGSIASAYLAYAGDFPIGGMPVAEVAAGRPAILTALRAIRGTSAAFGLGFAVFFLATVLGPYRRGEKRAWWTMLVAVLALALVILARIPALDIPFGQGGSGLAISFGGLTLLGLLLDVGRLRAS
jgi:hypothetical protein